MSILTRCCCCLELQVGVAVMGWLGAILSALDIVTVIVSLATQKAVFDANIALTLVSFLLHFIVAVCLIRATQTRNKRLLVPWLVVSILNLILMNIVLILVGVHLEQLAVYITSALLADALGLYFWLCVYSYYQELDELV